MIFAAKAVVGGLPAKMARDFMRDNRFIEIDGAATVSDYCKISSAQAQEFIEFCVSAGWLVEAERSGAYTATELGNQAGVARIGKSITRAKATETVSAVVRRAQEWNAMADVPFFITDVRVFGSYLTDAETLGDVDLAVDFVRRPGYAGLGFEENKRVAEALAKSQGWAAPNAFMDVHFFCQLGLMRYLKARNPVISLVDGDQVQLLKCPTQVIFHAAL